jgi:hypothetical protein
MNLSFNSPFEGINIALQNTLKNLNIPTYSGGINPTYAEYQRNLQNPPRPILLPIPKLETSTTSNVNTNLRNNTIITPFEGINKSIQQTMANIIPPKNPIILPVDPIIIPTKSNTTTNKNSNTNNNLPSLPITSFESINKNLQETWTNILFPLTNVDNKNNTKLDVALNKNTLPKSPIPQTSISNTPSSDLPKLPEINTDTLKYIGIAIVVLLILNR